ncbi:MAG: DNA mismatch repair endonuclease MutL [Spirochaetales bacterium]
MTKPHAPRRIKVLRDEVARKIAAGEVIDRPLSVLRELIDNSLDAGATHLDIRLVSGGLQSLEVTDNGCGMTREDLELCWLPHTTSKIESEEDLNTLSSLGFRGEALASISACSRVRILTSTDDTGLAWELKLEEGQPPSLKKASGPRGTRVTVEDLFYNIPARRKFLKSSSAEQTLCRRVVEEKALARPDCGFSLWQEGTQRAYFAPGPELQRVQSVLGAPWDAAEVLVFQAQRPGLAVHGFSLAPPHSRSDRKGIRIYANGRPLQEFALVQAVTYAYEGYLPGGAWPLAVVFAEVDPALVDFNIHPAKREARFRNAADLHQALVEGVREALTATQLAFPPAQRTEQQPLAFELPQVASPALRGRAQLPSVDFWDAGGNELRETPALAPGFRYLGQVLGVFLVAEVGDTLYLVDQHAAHERILFDRYRAQGGEGQALLFPRRFLLEEDAARVVERQMEDWSSIGIGIRQLSPLEFELVRLPQLVVGRERELIEFLEQSRKPVADVEKDFYASFSCRAAVMDGDPLDPQAARELLTQAFALAHARCPHGRPLWTTLTRDELFTRVGRLV